MTSRLFDMLGREVLIDTVAGVARRTGIAMGTVRKVRDTQLARRLSDRQVDAPRLIGIDDTKLNGTWVSVIGDIGARRVIDLVKRSELEAFLKAMPGRDQVEVVCTDLRWTYTGICRRWFPRAVHVADKFHVVRRANNALEQVIASMRSHSGSRIQDQIRSVRPLLKRREHDLTDAQRLRVAAELGELPPLLGAAYRAKEDFYRMYERCGSVKEATRYYRRWKDSLSQEIVTPFTEHCVPRDPMLGAMFGYFDHPLTNAYVESLNRRIADHRREGRGYDFEALRGMVLLAPSLEHYVFRGAGRRSGTADEAH